MADTARTSKRKASKDQAKPNPTQGSSKALALGTLSIGAIVAAAGAAAFALFRKGRGVEVPWPEKTAAAAPKAKASKRSAQTASADASFGTGEHPPTDLMGEKHPGFEDRAVDAFRPDPTAPIPEGERDAFRPALAGAQAPTLVAGQAREHERTDAAPS